MHTCLCVYAQTKQTVSAYGSTYSCTPLYATAEIIDTPLEKFTYHLRHRTRSGCCAAAAGCWRRLSHFSPFFLPIRLTSQPTCSVEYYGVLYCSMYMVYAFTHCNAATVCALACLHGSTFNFSVMYYIIHSTLCIPSTYHIMFVRANMWCTCSNMHHIIIAPFQCCSQCTMRALAKRS